MLIDDVRNFLRDYWDNMVYVGRNGVPEEDHIPPRPVRQHQRDVRNSNDDHVIPRDRYRYRTEPPQTIDDHQLVISENIHLIESYWDTVIGSYGLGGVSIYLPFHQDVATCGIYVSQRGIRYLGYLLYGWGRGLSYDGHLGRLS